MISKKIVGLVLTTIAVGVFLFRTSHETDRPAVKSLPESIEDGIETPSVSAHRATGRFSTGVIDNLSLKTNSITEKIVTLQEIETRGDAQSFETILTELTNASPEIRQAALEAAIQFGSRDAIPVLKKLAAKTEDPREKVEILDAIEFLELPTFNEARQTRRTNSNPGRIQLPPK